MTDDLDFDAVSHVGMVRSENQDRFGIWTGEDAAQPATHGRLFVVCDGMGGHNGGSIASATTVDAVLASWRASTDGSAKRALAVAIDNANTEVRKKAAADYALKSMGTTLVALVVRGAQAHVAHIGDSRCYRIRDGKIEQVTRDHTYLNDLIEIGLLTPDKAKNHPDRNVITRCVGMADQLQVDFKPLDLKPGDAYLLCSDGLYNYCDSADMLQMVTTMPADQASQKLVDLANANGGEDNITCVVVKVNAVDGTLPPEPADETASTTRPITRPVPVTGGTGSAGGTAPLSSAPTAATQQVLPTESQAITPRNESELTRFMQSTVVTPARPIWRRAWVLINVVLFVAIVVILIWRQGL